MKINTKFCGTVEYEAKTVLHFPQGIPGFETSQQFIHVQPENSVFSSLQSLEDPEVAFVVISPFTICPEYTFQLNDEITEKLQLTKVDDALILGIITIPNGNLKAATVNLQAPLVINLQTNTGVQVILTDGIYPLRMSIWLES
jgi:flagellar assembly factor FliW